MGFPPQSEHQGYLGKQSDGSGPTSKYDSVFGSGPPAFANGKRNPLREEEEKVEPPQPTGPIDVDEMVIPTMAANAGANQMSEYPEGEDGNSAALKSVE